MDMDPHTLQQILLRIYQQMRCPQCGKRVPIDFSAVRVVSDGTMLLQLKCEGCNAYIVLQASLQGVDSITAPPYEDKQTANASTGLEVNEDDLDALRKALEKAGGSFEAFFGKQDTAPERPLPERSFDDSDADTSIV